MLARTCCQKARQLVIVIKMRSVQIAWIRHSKLFSSTAYGDEGALCLEYIRSRGVRNEWRKNTLESEQGPRTASRRRSTREDAAAMSYLPRVASPLVAAGRIPVLTRTRTARTPPTRTVRVPPPPPFQS